MSKEVLVEVNMCMDEFTREKIIKAYLHNFIYHPQLYGLEYILLAVLERKTDGTFFTAPITDIKGINHA